MPSPSRWPDPLTRQSASAGTGSARPTFGPATTRAGCALAGSRATIRGRAWHRLVPPPQSPCLRRPQGATGVRSPDRTHPRGYRLGSLFPHLDRRAFAPRQEARAPGRASQRDPAAASFGRQDPGQERPCGCRDRRGGADTGRRHPGRVRAGQGRQGRRHPPQCSRATQEPPHAQGERDPRRRADGDHGQGRTPDQQGPGRQSRQGTHRSGQGDQGQGRADGSGQGSCGTLQDQSRGRSGRSGQYHRDSGEGRRAKGKGHVDQDDRQGTCNQAGCGKGIARQDCSGQGRARQGDRDQGSGNQGRTQGEGHTRQGTRNQGIGQAQGRAQEGELRGAARAAQQRPTGPGDPRAFVFPVHQSGDPDNARQTRWRMANRC